MFDYNKIEAIDPSFLDQYLNPAKTGAAAFGYTETSRYPSLTAVGPLISPSPCGRG